PRCASTSFAPPTTTNLPSLIATASAFGRRRSSVVTRPLRRIRSAFSATAPALTDDPPTAYMRPAAAPDFKKSLRVWLLVMAFSPWLYPCRLTTERNVCTSHARLSYGSPRSYRVAGG